MPDNINKRFLVADLISKGSLSDRYENLECVNFDLASGDRRGVLSLVFKAQDILCDKTVAIKFMDPDRLADVYRLECFNREPEILKKLEGQRRCLELVDSIKSHDIIINFPGFSPVKLPCNFFALDWLDQEIDHYFNSQQDYDSYEKLMVFNKILLAVEAVHERFVHHRDLKPDNLRAFNNVEGESIVVVIDFGTAAAVETTSIKPPVTYDGPVGAGFYSSPEARMGFAGERSLGCATDIYALGCMLYGLFNPQLIMYKQMNPEFMIANAAINIEIFKCASIAERYVKWREIVPKFKHVLRPPPIDGMHSTLPSSIKDIISRLFLSMAEFDFSKRETSLRKIRHQVNLAMKVLLSSKAAELDRQRRKCLRLARQAKAQRKELHA